MKTASPRMPLAALALLSVVGCSRASREGGLTGALHTDVPGQSQPFGRATDDAGGTGDEPLLARTYAEEVTNLRRLVDRWWIHQGLHAERDGADVEAAFTELTAIAQGDPTPQAYALAVRSALCKLHDAHLQLLPSPQTESWSSGLALAFLAGQLTVVGVDERYADASPRPAVGDVVMSLDRHTYEEWAAATCVESASTDTHRRAKLASMVESQQRLAEEEPEPGELVLRHPGDEEPFPLQLEWQRSDAEPSACVVADVLPEGAAVLRVRDLDCRSGAESRPDPERFARELEAAVRSVGEAPAVILDLRRASGVLPEQADLLAARLGETVATLPMRVLSPDDPHNEPTRFVSMPRTQPGGARYDGPLWVLVGPRCAGACELAAALLTERPGTQLIGESTAGAVGKARVFKLPHSALMVGIPHMTYALPSTEDLIEGRGVTPNLEVLPTLDAILEGRDPVLEAATARITP